MGLLGYVPRYLAAEVSDLFRSRDLSFLQSFVEQVNQDAPLPHSLAAVGGERKGKCGF